MHGQMKAGQFLFLLRRFDEFHPKIDVLSGSHKRKENELSVCNKHGLHGGCGKGDAPSHRWGFGGLAKKRFEIWGPKVCILGHFQIYFTCN